MATGFLHGVETIRLIIGGAVITSVKSAVIGMVGTAPIGALNELKQVVSENDGTQFGLPLPGFTIPKAIEARNSGKSGTMLIVNVYDPTIHNVTVTDEPHTLENGRTKLLYAPMTPPVIKNQAMETLVIDTHYTYDEYGNIVFTPQALNGFTGGSPLITETATTSITATYERFDPSLVLPAHLIGSIGAGNVRTGFKLMKIANNLFGYKPKLLICPNYAHLTSIANEMASQALPARAQYMLDAPLGFTPDDAIQSRGPASTTNFNRSDKRAILCFPQLKAFDTATDADENRPYSQYLAALIALNDNTLASSYAASPSNKEIPGITGMEQPIEWDLNDENCEANQLNAAGIMTAVSGFGLGIRAWGNRNASFPSNNKADSFICVNRVADILDETVEQGCLIFLDQDATPALIDSVVADINATMRAMEQLGRLMPGSSCIFDPLDNPIEQIAAGHLVFAKTFLPPLPAERITNKSKIDITLLRNLFAAA